MNTVKRKIGPLESRAIFAPETYNPEDNTIEMVFATEAKVRRFSWSVGEFDEVLDLEPGSVRLGRLLNGASVLNNHDRNSLDSVLGVVSDAWIKERQGYAKVKLSEREDLKDIIQDIKSGVIRNVSVGYIVHKYMDDSLPEAEIKTFRAVDWEPYEVSFVPVPADANSQVRSNEFVTETEIISREDSLKTRNDNQEPVTEPVTEPKVEPTQEPVKEEPKAEPVAEPVKEEPKADEVQAEQERCLEINESCMAHGLSKDFARKLITEKVEIGLARKMIINKIAEGKSMQTQNTNVTIVADEKDKQRNLVELAIASKIGLKVDIDSEVNAMRNLSLVEMAKHLNPALRMLSKREVAIRSMHSTGDFPLIFGNVASKSLRKAYDVAPKTFQNFSRQVELPDYKEKTVIQLGSAPELKAIAEGGEYEYGTIGEGAEKYKLSKYGRKIRLTEEMFVNDDLEALQRLPAAFGNASARLESKLVYGILTGNPNMADGVALFHATHKNLGTTGALGETTLDELFTLIGEQKFGDDMLNLSPAFLVVGQKNRMLAQKILAAITAGKSGDVNVFQNALQPIVDANISDKSFYTICHPDQYDTIEYAYLEGMVGPEVRSIADEANDSVIIKCKHVFAAKAVDYRGMAKNAGPT